MMPLMWFLLGLLLAATNAAPPQLSASSARLPNSLVSLWNEFTAPAEVATSIEEDDSEDIRGVEATTTPSSAFCILKSRTTTRADQLQVVQSLLHHDKDAEEAELLDHFKAVACRNDSVLCLAAPSNLAEAAACTVATRGNLLYVLSTVDVQRGEGLVEPLLLVALQQVLDNGLQKKAQLTVVVPSGVTEADAQKALYESLEPIWGSLSSSVSTLKDIFGGGVEFVTLEQAKALVWDSAQEEPLETNLGLLNQAAAGYSTSSVTTTSFSAQDWAAARLLAPKAQAILDDCLETVSQAMQHEQGGGDKLVPDFGRLCSSVWSSAENQFQSLLQETNFGRSPTTQRVQQVLLMDPLREQLQAMITRQVELQFSASMGEFKKKLSGMLIGPNLKQDMYQKVAQPCRESFAKKAQHMTFAQAQLDLVGPAVAYFGRTVNDQVSQRWLKARASGKFRPLPRKGVTVGMHWLLPKPFGNDYRQEPWKVHAADDMVYVPSAIQEVNPDDVVGQEKDWRGQIVPSPVGNDLIYTQN